MLHVWTLVRKIEECFMEIFDYEWLNLHFIFLLHFEQLKDDVEDLDPLFAVIIIILEAILILLQLIYLTRYNLLGQFQDFSIFFC